MARTRWLLLVSLSLLSGCHGGPVQQDTDRVLLDLATHPFDPAPPQSAEDKPKAEETAPSAHASASTARASKRNAGSDTGESELDIQTVALMQRERAPAKSEEMPKYELKVPPGLPGSDVTPLPHFDRMTPQEKERAIRRFYPEMPPLPEAPTPVAGPNGQPYTLSDFQKLAVENSPTLRQAVSDVKAAEGSLWQARTYQNPTFFFSAQPTNNNSNAGAQGGYLEQPLRMWGKMKLSVAMAQKDVDNAKLALRRAQFDLATNVRNAYFALIVARETVRVNQALARFTDEIYHLYAGYLAAGAVAAFEPAPLRAQAFAVRLAYQQSLVSYTAAWQQLVATLGLPHLPLTEVSGRVDRLIPYYDHDKVLAYVLTHHTDVLTARNGVQRAQYNLKLAQITPYPDVDIQASMWKESTIVPYTIFYAAQVGFPVPIWDQNKGNIKNAQAALIRAVEESHRVENVLTNTLAASYGNYRNNLYALEYYRRYILPEQVRYYRGIFDRRQVDKEASPADLVTAQQALTLNVQNYLAMLGSLWTSVVSVADLMQTPDLFQLAQPHDLPELPDLDQMPRWLCPHCRRPAAPVGGPGCAPAVRSGQPAAAPVGSTPSLPATGEPMLPAPRPATEQPSGAEQRTEATPGVLTEQSIESQLTEPPPEISRQPGVPQTAGEPASGGETP